VASAPGFIEGFAFFLPPAFGESSGELVGDVVELFDFDFRLNDGLPSDRDFGLKRPARLQKHRSFLGGAGEICREISKSDIGPSKRNRFFGADRRFKPL
jgi:hypothetical protein